METVRRLCAARWLATHPHSRDWKAPPRARTFSPQTDSLFFSICEHGSFFAARYSLHFTFSLSCGQCSVQPPIIACSGTIICKGPGAWLLPDWRLAAAAQGRAQPRGRHISNQFASRAPQYARCTEQMEGFPSSPLPLNRLSHSRLPSSRFLNSSTGRVFEF